MKTIVQGFVGILALTIVLTFSNNAAIAVGPFNTVGHETEGMSREGSAQLLAGLSEVFQMLRQIELGDRRAADGLRNKALAQIEVARNRFEGVRKYASKRLFVASSIKLSAQVRRLQIQLHRMGVDIPNSSQELANVSIQEVVRFETDLKGVSLHEPTNDLQTFELLIASISRLLEIGMISSELSAITGSL